MTVTAQTAQFQKAMTGVNAQTAATGNTVSKFGTVAKIGLGLAALAAVKFATDSIEAYKESELALAELGAALDRAPQLVGETTKAFEEQAAALQELSGIQDEEVMAAQAVLTRFNLTGDEIRKLTPLIVDYARVVDTDAVSAAENIGKALLGNTRALKTVGIEFKATGDTAEDTASIIDSLSKKVGGAAETFGKTAAGQIAIFNARIDEAKEALGEKLLPVILEVVEALGGLLDLVMNPTPWDQSRLAQERFGEAFAKWAEVAKTEAPEALHLVAQGVGNVSDEMQVMAQATEAGISDWEGLLALYAQGGVAIEDLVDAYKAQQGASEGLSVATGVLYGFTVDQTRVTSDLGAASIDAASAMREQRLATLALTDSFLGILDSAKQVNEAQRELNRLERQGKEDTAAYKDQVLLAIDAQSGLEQSIITYAQELADSGQTAKDVKEKIRELGDQFGLQGDVVNDLISDVLAYIRSLKDIPSRVTTDITAFWSSSSGHRPPELQHGGIVSHPTLALIGEAGPEAVIPLSSVSGMATTVNVTVNGWLGNDQQLAARIRDELVRLQRLNAGTTGIR